MIMDWKVCWANACNELSVIIDRPLLETTQRLSAIAVNDYETRKKDKLTWGEKGEVQEGGEVMMNSESNFFSIMQWVMSVGGTHCGPGRTPPNAIVGSARATRRVQSSPPVALRRLPLATPRWLMMSSGHSRYSNFELTD